MLSERMKVDYARTMALKTLPFFATLPLASSNKSNLSKLVSRTSVCGLAGTMIICALSFAPSLLYNKYAIALARTRHLLIRSYPKRLVLSI